MRELTLQELNETRPEEIRLDPTQGEWWTVRLEWLLMYEPQGTKELFLTNRKRLYQSLKLAVQRAFLQEMKLQHNKSLAPDQIREIVTSAIAPTDGEQKPPLPESLEEKIRAWAEDPPENSEDRKIGTM